MAVRIEFDSTYNVQSPTFILATRNGNKLGVLPAYNIVFKDKLNSYSELSFKINKFDNGKTFWLWDKVKDFKLMWCKEWNIWFEIYVEINESNELIKNVSAKSLGESELSQIILYNIEINTENDISQDDYVPTVLFDGENPKASLLNRIMEKAPHYRIKHVDSSIAKIQRTFSFDNKSLYDAFQEISEEISCIFIINSSSDENGKIDRAISVYDLESYCVNCGKRGNFLYTCPECKSDNLMLGYGDDTTIFISTDNLASDIVYSTDVDSVKNCFKLEAGDDLMTATLVNCNPNGTGYLWYISDEVKEDMSDDLVNKLNKYDELYQYYQDKYNIQVDSYVEEYNSLVDKYSIYNPDLERIKSTIVGYPALMSAYYNTVDLEIFLQSTLMPDSKMSNTTAQKEAELLTAKNISPVSVTDVSIISSATADSAVLAMAKVIVDSRYQVKVNSSSLTNNSWTGNFIITNYSDEDDTATSETITLVINDNYANYVQQKIEKILNKEDTEDFSISGLIKRDYLNFCAELKKYSLSYLVMISDCCQSCIDILIEQGIANKDTWSGSDPNLYDDLYLPYYNKLKAAQTEASLREKEIKTITGFYDFDGTLIVGGLQNEIVKAKDKIQSELNFENYLGETLWLEFCSYRREDTYSNSNYISDGLNNAQLFQNALEFIEVAKNDIYKSANLQHSISSTLNNLLVIKEFSPITKYFEIGNWIRVKVDEKIYRLRLVDYEIDFDNLDNISITFSDVKSVSTGFNDVESILNQAASMSTSYDSVQRQASQGAKSNNIISDWVKKGLDATNTKIIGGADNQTQTWDNHGMLFRKYDSITDSYLDTQLKIINSTLAVTDDNWETVKTAVGNFYYFDPKTNELKNAYGVNAEMLIGDLIVGQGLRIQTPNNEFVIDESGIYYKQFDELNGTVEEVSNTVNGYSKEITTIKENITNIENKKMYRCTVQSSDGEIFKNGIVSTVLTATVWSWDDDITSTIPATAFHWTRKSAYPERDEYWNEHNGVNENGNVRTITQDDVDDRAVFKCEIDLEE